MNQLNQITQQNASASEQLAATAEEMSGQADNLQQLMSFFKLDGNARQSAVFAHEHLTKLAVNPKNAPKSTPSNNHFDQSNISRHQGLQK